MDLFEYQGKQYFARFDIPVSPGDVAYTVDEAVAAAEAAGYPVVVKAQVQVGGRGKAGGIKLADNADEVRLHAGNILGMDIKGHLVKRVWVEHASDIDKEYYASYSLDRGAKKHLLMLSAEGGVEIEAVAVENPDAIVMLHIDPVDGLSLEVARDAAVRAEHRRRGGRRRGRHARQALPLLHRGRLRPRRDQPADPAAGRRRARARREGQPRQQRRVPAPRVGRVPRHRGARRARAARPHARPAVHRPRGQGRHHRQRRRPRDVDARRRQPGRRLRLELPRHRRRRQRRHDDGGTRGHQLRPEREEHLHQHLRRHHPRRGSGEGHRRGAAAASSSARRSSSASTAPTPRRVARSCSTPASPSRSSPPSPPCWKPPARPWHLANGN